MKTRLNFVYSDRHPAQEPRGREPRALLALTVLVVRGLGMASATGINVMERTREIGVLRAIGATPAVIYRLFVAEGIIISVDSIFLGLVLSWPLSIAAAPFFGNLMLGERPRSGSPLARMASASPWPLR